MADLQEISDRLIRVETSSEERWKAHDVKSDIIWHEIKNDIKALFAKVDLAISRKNDCMKEARSYVNKIVSVCLGVPVTLFVLIRLFSK